MRVAVLDLTVLDRLHPKDPLRRWQAELLAGGYFVDPGGDPRTEARVLAGMEGKIGALWRAAEKVDHWRHPLPWLRGGVPNEVWALMAIIFGMLIFGWGTLIAMMGAPVVWGGMAIGGLLASVWQMQVRRKKLKEAEVRYRLLMEELKMDLELLCRSNFVIRSSTATIVCVPHLIWCRHRLRDLRENYVPNPSPERESLQQDLQQLVAGMEKAVDQMDATALVCDLAPYAERFAALKLRKGAEGVVLDRILRDFTPP